MNKDKIIGICVASLLFSVLSHLSFIDSDILFSLPIIIFVVAAFLTSINVYKEKRWAYWLALGLSLIQVGLFIVEQIDIPGVLFWEDLSAIFTTVSSIILIKKKAEPVT